MTSDSDIHSARFGNRGGAHDVLQDSGAPRVVLDSIKWFTDRPGTRWAKGSDCTHAGYLAEGHYVVQSTKPDHQAGRGGMVTTTALLIPDRFVTEIDLGLALEAADALAEQERLQPVDARSLHRPERCTHARGADALADSLASAGMAVWLGPGHREALACLWRHLGTDDRSRFAFTATDHPDVAALPRSRVNLRVLVVPVPLPAAFAGIPVVGLDSETTDGPAAALFESDNHPASLLASQLGLAKPTLRQWQHLITAERELRGVHDGSIENTLAVLALLGLLAPDPAVGAVLKEETLDQLHRQAIGRPYEVARAIRTVPWDALLEPDGRRTMTASWVSHAAADWDTASIAAALEELEHRDNSWFPELHQEITGVLAADLHLTIAVAADLLLRADGRAALQTAVRDSRLDTSPEFDRVLSTALAGRAAAGWAADEARRRGWATVHASVVDTTDPVAAWRTHLPVATNASAELLAGRVAPSANVAAALKLAHSLLIRLAGRLTATDPSLLSPPQPAELVYRQVWAAAIRCGMPASACCSPADAAPVLLEAWLRGSDIDDVLLEAIGDEVGPFLARHTDRARLWALSDTPVVNRLRAAVAAYVARALNIGDPVPESPLAREILAEPTLTALAREQPAQAVTVLEILAGIAQDRHGALVAKNMTRATPETAYRVGSLTRERGWHDTARHLVTCGRADLQPAAHEAADILGFVDRLFLRRLTGGSAIPEPNATDTLAAILDVLSDIYPEGPPIELWERAGGRAAYRPLSRTGRQAWQAALTAITAGSAGAPSMTRLLAEAHREYPRNQMLLALREHTASRNTWRYA